MRENGLCPDGQFKWLVDTAAVEDRIHGLCFAMSARDRIGVAAAFAPNADCRHGGFQGSPDGLLDQIERGQARPNMTELHLTGHVSEIRGEHAGAESYLLMPITASGRDGMCGGRLLHQLVRLDGEWLIARHELVLDWGFEWPDDSAEGTAAMETAS